MDDTQTGPGQGAGKRLPEEVVRLGWISFFTDISSEMAYPVLPLFLTVALGAPVAVLGLIEGAAECIVSLMKGLSGLLSDRMRKRTPFVRIGYGLGAASKPVLAMAFSWPIVFLARAADRLGKGLRTSARDAMIADVVDATGAGRAFGFHRMMDTAGALLGVLVSVGLLFLFPGQYRLIFLLTAIPGAAAVWLAFKLREPGRGLIGAERPEGPFSAAGPSGSSPGVPGTTIGQLLCGYSRRYWGATGLLMLFALANSTDTLLILRAQNLGLGDAAAVLGYVVFNLTYTLTAYPAGALSDRLGRRRVLIAGFAVYAASYVGFALTNAGGVYWLFALYGVSIGLTEGVGRALIASLLPADRKGRGLGLFHMGIGFSALLGSLVAGIVWDELGPAAPFWLGGGLALVAILAALAGGLGGADESARA